MTCIGMFADKSRSGYGMTCEGASNVKAGVHLSHSVRHSGCTFWSVGAVMTMFARCQMLPGCSVCSDNPCCAEHVLPGFTCEQLIGGFSHAVLLTIYTGSQNLLALRTLSSEFCRHAFSYSIWNKLPLSIRSVNSFSSMKSRLKTHLFAPH